MARLFGRRKPGWWQEPAGWLLGLVVVFPGGLAAIPVSEHASGWVAVAAEVAGLAILAAAAVEFFVVKRNSWLLAAPLAFGVSFSLFLALVEGWDKQVKAALSIAQIVFVVGAAGILVAGIVVGTRASRRVSRAFRDMASEAGERIAHEGLFHDDGERITVYASRGKTLLRLLTGLVAVGIFVGAYALAAATVLNTFWRITLGLLIALMLVFAVLNMLLMLARSLMSSPTLIINADGIVDSCSLIVTGRGLLRWNETLDVEEFISSTNKFVTYRFLDINVADAHAINRRQPFWKRLLAVFTSVRQPLGYRIASPLLDRPPAALAQEISRYIAAHAPAGSWHKDVNSEEPDDEADG